MTIANKNNITQRDGLGRPLSRGEMDDNFEELKNVIDDATANESTISDHVNAVDPHPQYTTEQDVVDIVEDDALALIVALG